VGVVSSHDFLLLHTAHPVSIATEIGRAVSIEGLASLSGRLTALVRRLVAEGGTAYDIGQVVAELNDRIVARTLGLVTGHLETAGEGHPPVAYCWLALGSEARREQTLRTDQDNGLVYADPPDDLRSQATAYFGHLADAAIGALGEIGVPLCTAGMMASNPEWCQPLSVWAGYFHRWMEEARPAHVLAACIHFDLRPVAGDAALAQPLRELVGREAPGHRRFLTLLARDVVSRRLPLTVLGGIATRRTGPRRGTVDLKGAGSLQIVGAGRLHALELGIGETNTVDRFRAAAARGLYREDETREITDAYQHLLRLRLERQLEALGRGEPPDNDVHPDHLSHADRVLLREALRTVARLQGRIRERFATDFAP
jgi:CBS domain-containing protein